MQDCVHRDAEGLGDRRVSLVFQVHQVMTDNGLDERAAQPQVLDLRQQALREITRRHADRIKTLDHLEHVRGLRKRHSGR